MPDITASRPAAGAPIETAWGQQVQDMLEGLQAGAVVMTLTASTTVDLVITYPRAYTATPVVSVICAGGSVTLVSLPSVPGAASFTVRAFKRDGSALAAGSLNVYWIAIGTLATPG